MAFPFAAKHSVWSKFSKSTKSIGRRLLPGFAQTQLPRRAANNRLSAAILSLSQSTRDRFVFEGMEPRLLMSADPYQLAAGADVSLRLGEDDEQNALIQLVDNSEEGSPVIADWVLADLGGTLTINGTSDDESLSLDRSLTSLDSPLTITFNAGDGNDALVGPTALIDDTDNPQGLIDWALSAANAGVADLDGSATNSSLAFTGVESIEAGDGEDTVQALGSHNWNVLGANSFLLQGITFSGVENLNANGSDHLDYSAYADGDVSVDLSTGIATGFSGISGFMDVTGSAQNDLLIGDDNINVLSGGDGSDELQGGLGNDTLIGGDGIDTVFASRASSMTLLDGSLSIGAELDTLVGIDNADLTITGAVGYTLDASGFNAGGTTLIGGDGNDTLIGSNQDDRFAGGLGDDTIVGNGQVLLDTIVAERDADMALVHTDASTGSGTLTIALTEVDNFSGIETALLTGGESSNQLDAQGFDNIGGLNGVGVTLDGGAGNDILIGSQDDDFLTGGLGLDDIQGRSGNDTLIETGDNRFIIADSGILGSAGTLDRGDGDNEIQTLLLTGASSGYFTLTFDGEETGTIAFDASAEELGVALRSVSVPSHSGGWA